MSTAEALPAAPEQITDEEIVRRVVAGDTPLFEILLRRHNQRIYRAVRAVLRSEEEVEDAMQQAYLSAFRHLGQFSERAQFKTWLARIAVNEASARLRKRHRLEIVGEDEVMERATTSEPDPEQQAAGSQLREVMEREVAELPDIYRAVFLLREVEGLSTHETAHCLSIEEDAVKTRLHRARNLLRERLYRRAGVTLESLFTFGSARCDRVVAGVMAQLHDLQR